MKSCNLAPTEAFFRLRLRRANLSLSAASVLCVIRTWEKSGGGVGITSEAANVLLLAVAVRPSERTRTMTLIGHSQAMHLKAEVVSLSHRLRTKTEIAAATIKL